MVLEALIDDESIIRKPVFMLMEAFIVSSIALWTSFYTFPSSASILAVAFITIALVPVMHSVFIKEETFESVKKGNPIAFIGRHFEIISIYAFFFIGLILSYSLWFVLLPETTQNVCIAGNCFQVPDKKTMFSEQNKTLNDIEKLRGNITGNATLSSSQNSNTIASIFNLIFFNNAEVMIFAVILSFIYGAGALMLIGWNASIIGTLIGQSILQSNHLRFIGLLPHGIPEVIAYFLAAISGSLISIAVTKKQLVSNELKTIIIDAITILIIALITLAIGAIIEALLVIKSETLALTISMVFIIAFSFMVMLGFKK